MSDLGESTIGTAGAVYVFSLFILLTTDVHYLYKYLATGTAVLIVCLIVGINVRKRRRLHQNRLEQMQLHRTKDYYLNPKR